MCKGFYFSSDQVALVNYSHLYGTYTSKIKKKKNTNTEKNVHTEHPMFPENYNPLLNLDL